MAQFAIHGGWKSVAALSSLFVLIGMMTYAVAGGLEHLPVNDAGVSKRVSYGLALYGFALLVIILGFWSKEDVIAISGIVGISALLLLDIILRIGVLSFNMI
jgi:hypothetical protein